MLDWLIVGGGIHGTHLSLYLTRRKAVPPHSLRVLDPYDAPLALWKQFTANVGMEYLRSSHAHNLHYDPFSLATFVRTRVGEPLARFIEPYGRPALDLFNTHSERLIERYRLDTLRLTGRAERLVRLRDGWRVETQTGSVEARRVILTAGNTEKPYWPGWARDLRAAGAPVYHIFDPAFSRAALTNWQRAVVLGGGITAVQTALRLALDAPGTVTLLMRHDLRVFQFDADPGWIGPRYLEGFHRERDYTRRRAIITAARHRGSMPSDVAQELQQAALAALLTRRMDDVTGATCLPDGQIALQLAGGDSLVTDCLILATGFDNAEPGGAWVTAAASDYDLPRAPDGYPIVDERLCWASGLYVSGALAELEVGPVARNIIGARLAADRIGASV